jgi:hypothetical protein
MRHLLGAVKGFIGGSGDEVALARQTREEMTGLLRMFAEVEEQPEPLHDTLSLALAATHLPEDNAGRYVLFGWLFTHALGRMAGTPDSAGESRSWIDEWRLGRFLAGAFTELGLDEGGAWWRTGLVKILTAHQQWSLGTAQAPVNTYTVLTALLGDEDVRNFLRINRHQDVLWFNSEAFDELLGWLLLIDLVRAGGEVEAVLPAFAVINDLHLAKEASGYQIGRLLDAVEREQQDDEA